MIAESSKGRTTGFEPVNRGSIPLSAEQLRLPNIQTELFKARLEESRVIVRRAVAEAKKPVIVQFSGGRDSMAMVGLIQEVTLNFVLCYNKSGIEFPEAVSFAEDSARQLGCRLLVSCPEDHRGGFFERLPQFGWPTVRKVWCNRDLKVRPAKKLIARLFGLGVYHKMVGVRRWESSRRRKIYSADKFFAVDGRDILVYPLLNWTQYDVSAYLASQALPTSSLYKRFGVSGCYWCPFYQVAIYERILRKHPNLYDEFITWEAKLGPSVNGFIYLRDLKERMVNDA